MEDGFTVSSQPTLTTILSEENKKGIVMWHVVIVTKIPSSMGEKMLEKSKVGYCIRIIFMYTYIHYIYICLNIKMYICIYKWGTKENEICKFNNKYLLFQICDFHSFLILNDSL